MGLINSINDIQYTLDRKETEKNRKAQEKQEFNNYLLDIEEKTNAIIFEYFEKYGDSSKLYLLKNKYINFDIIAKYITGQTQKGLYGQNELLYNKNYNILRDAEKIYLQLIDKYEKERKTIEKLEEKETEKEIYNILKYCINNMENKNIIQIFDVLNAKSFIKNTLEEIKKPESIKEYYKALKTVKNEYIHEINTQKENKKNFIEYQKANRRNGLIKCGILNGVIITANKKLNKIIK